MVTQGPYCITKPKSQSDRKQTDRRDIPYSGSAFRNACWSGCPFGFLDIAVDDSSALVRASTKSLLVPGDVYIRIQRRSLGASGSCAGGGSGGDRGDRGKRSSRGRGRGGRDR